MKRRLTKLVLFLLLGAIVNVAVAWGCAVSIDGFRADMDGAYPYTSKMHRHAN